MLGLTPQAAEPKAFYRIGDLSREFGVTLRTLRFYEDRGLLQPTRRGVTRIYSSMDYRRLRLILLCKTLGFSLTEIQRLVEHYLHTTSPKRQLDELRAAFQRQRSQLLSQREGLEASMAAIDASLAALKAA
nr:MerR family transcriptional regulator [Aureimonas leprariae]